MEENRKTMYAWPYRTIEDVRKDIPYLISNGALEDSIEVLYNLEENYFYIRFEELD